MPVPQENSLFVKQAGKPVLENGARCELKPTFAIRQGVKSLAGQKSILYFFLCQYNIIIN
jgi:hypothetical protein